MRTLVVRQLAEWIVACAACGVSHASDVAIGRADAGSRPVAQYERVVASLSAQGRLDEDRVFTARARAIAARLIAAAPALNASAASWSWEVHTSGDPSIDAFCMPGGKLMIGSAFASALALDDAELAMLVAHEIAHALAGHRRTPEADTTEMDMPRRTRMIAVAFEQERQADEMGLRLAVLAGWPAADLVRFYEKLAARDEHASFSDTHPPAAARLEAARQAAAALETTRSGATAAPR